MDPIVSPTPLSDCYLITFSFTYKISLLWNREKDVEGTWNKTKATEQHAQNSDRRACLYCVCVCLLLSPQNTGCHWRNILEGQYRAADYSSKNGNTEDKQNL